MTHKYDDPVTDEVIEAAVQLTVRMRSERWSAPLEELANHAVDIVFCTCATTAADASVSGRSPVHAGVIAEVLSAGAAARHATAGGGSPDRSGGRGL